MKKPVEIAICAVRDMNDIDFFNLFHYPFYLLSNSSITFSHLANSLVLNKQYATCSMDDIQCMLVPFTSTSFYLFLLDLNKVIPMASKQVCDLLLQHSSNQLFFHWKHISSSIFIIIVDYSNCRSNLPARFL